MRDKGQYGGQGWCMIKGSSVIILHALAWFVSRYHSFRVELHTFGLSRMSITNSEASVSIDTSGKGLNVRSISQRQKKNVARRFSAANISFKLTIYTCQTMCMHPRGTLSH